MTEEELLTLIEAAKKETKRAIHVMLEAKKHWINCESDVIASKINEANLIEQLRILSNSIPKASKELRDLDIRYFQETYPDVCDFAKQRDINRKDD